MKCILVMGLFFSFRAESQCLSKDVLVNYQSWSRYKEIDQFYALNQGIPIWLKKQLIAKGIFGNRTAVICRWAE